MSDPQGVEGPQIGVCHTVTLEADPWHGDLPVMLTTDSHCQAAVLANPSVYSEGLGEYLPLASSVKPLSSNYPY